MREKIIVCIALVCILVYAAAIGFGAFQIYDNMQEQSVLAKTEYAYLKNLSVFTAQSVGFMTDAYKAEMSRALFATKTVQAFIISGSNNSFAEERRGGLINTVNGDPRLKTNPVLMQYGDALQINGVRNPYINMTADVFDHSLFIITLKNTLLIILGALALVFFTLITDALIAKQKLMPEKDQQPQDENEEMFNFNTETIDFDIPSMDEDVHTTTDEQESVLDEIIPDDNFDVPSEENIPDLSVDINIDENICDGPTGLYSPHGNISWEAYTKDRLASELHRCASFEQDVVFIIMEFRGDKQNDNEFFNTFTEMAVNFFGPRDMIFEWREDGISIIVPNIDLDQCVSKCEDFHNRVKTKLLHSSSLEQELCIGLSSRAGRLIDPNRLIFETSQAVSRALVDPVSPIIAFKPDPEKYRAFIATQNLD
jgi:hypothetical protein